MTGSLAHPCKLALGNESGVYLLAVILVLLHRYMNAVHAVDQ